MDSATPDILRQFTRQVIEAFFMYPHVVAAVISVVAAAVIVGGYWAARGSVQGVRSARLALKAQALRASKDHRALVLMGRIGGGGAKLRTDLANAIEQNFGAYAFHAPVRVEAFPMSLPALQDGAPIQRRRRVASAAVEALQKSDADILIWGRKRMGGKVDLFIATPPPPNQIEDFTTISFKLRSRDFDAVAEAIAYACARRARPVLNKPQDYKPEKLQPIVEALEKFVTDPPASLSDGARLEILSDFASGALSLGERGGNTGWLSRALDARRQYLDRLDRAADPAAWGRAQQEVGRALAALGEREADRAKLEEAVGILKTSIDALRATESLQSAEVAMRALSRAEQTLAARRRVGLRWPV
ncbi:MAG: hypothetical protein KJS97_04170 [Alphaproteobacteria bacterium]|nr:hypothetical protein [Alphaproteobacteria bacterium]